MSKILLIQPNLERFQEKPTLDPGMPIGLIYLGTALKDKGHEVRILDRNVYPSNEYLKKLLMKDYDFVGVGSYTSKMLYDALDVSKIVKENSNSIVIWGGFHATIVPEQTTKNPYIDYIIRGEAEEIFLKILDLYEKKKDFSKIKGVNLNPPACPPNINELPEIDYSLVELEKYANLYVSTARGCPYICTFCYNSYRKESVKPYRNLEVKKAISLIENVVNKYKKKTFTITDDNFPSDKKRMYEICTAIKNLDVRFDTFSRANYCDLKTLNLLKKSGCWQIQIGVESGSQRILDFLKKGTSVEMNAEAIKNCRKIGIFSHCAFMIGIPTETEEDLKKTYYFIQKNKPDLGGAGFFIPFPKTVLWDYCVKEKLIDIPNSIEEWAGKYQGFDKLNVNVSNIPNNILIKYSREMNYILNKRRYIKKFFLYIKNRRLPDYRRVVSTVKEKIIF